jgi:uncharacterized membrane protein YkvA (DUF1232 family)
MKTTLQPPDFAMGVETTPEPPNFSLVCFLVNGDLAVTKKRIVGDNSADLAKIYEPIVSVDPEEVRPEPVFAMSWREQARRLQREAYVSYFVFRHPRTRWYARLVAACTAAYLFSPIQLIPNYIPVIGMLDDLLVIFLGVRLLRKITPADVLAESRRLADAAEVRRKEKIKSRFAVVASVAFVTVWLLVAIAASVLMARYIYRR